MMEQEKQSVLKGKLKVMATLRVDTGLHIGASSDFAPIGAVDSPFLRDPMTKQPIIPGSSLKGKIRTLLARSHSTQEYVLNQIENDIPQIKRLFGTAAKGNAGGKAARLEFYDIAMTSESAAQFGAMELDTYIGEIKWENVIERATAGAKPRQIERVPAGTVFDFKLVYNIEREDEVIEDMKILGDGLRLLQMDYLGGHGSRGYGRVSFTGFAVEHFTLSGERMNAVQLHEIEALLQKGDISV